MKKINLKNVIVKLLESGIMHVHLKPRSNIELSDAVLIVEAIGKLGGGKKFPVLIDAGEFSSIDKEARIFSASEQSNLYTLADAIAFCNLAQKMMADFYLKHNKPTVPTKAFSTKKEAVVWLKSFIK